MATKRSLSAREISEARAVFGNALDYRAVTVIEDWPWMLRFMRLFLRARVETVGICVGNNLLFSRPIDTDELADMCWLIHEMTHAWQFQNRGWVYLPDALWAQIRLGKAAYNYGSLDEFEKRSRGGATIESFNPEQQGNIARDYYWLLKKGRDTEAWRPFVEDIRRSR